jgi:hypothetical protein
MPTPTAPGLKPGRLRAPMHGPAHTATGYENHTSGHSLWWAERCSLYFADNLGTAAWREPFPTCGQLLCLVKALTRWSNKAAALWASD